MLKIILVIFFKMQDEFLFSPAVMAHILNPISSKTARTVKQRNPVSKDQMKLLMTEASFYLQDRGTLTCE